MDLDPISPRRGPIREISPSTAAGPAEVKLRSKSWRNKYRKMRIGFHRTYQLSEDYFQHEQLALRTLKRLSVENDRILDLLLDSNQSSHVPFDKRIDLSVDVPSSLLATLPLDRIPPRPRSGKSHPSPVAVDASSKLFTDAVAMADADLPDSDTYPPAFLTADDIDNYLYDIDLRLNPANMLPTLAPAATACTHSSVALNSGLLASVDLDPWPVTGLPDQLSRDFLRKNPVSAFNWLYKHVPSIFLQDGVIGAEEPVDAPTNSHATNLWSGKLSGDKAAKAPTTTAKAKKPATTSPADSPRSTHRDPESTPGPGPSPVPTSVTKGEKRRRETDPGSGNRDSAASSGSRPEKKRRKGEKADAGGLTPTPQRRPKEPTKKEPTKKEPTKKEPVKKEPTKESVKKESVKKEPTKEPAKEPTKKESAKESASSASPVDW